MARRALGVALLVVTLAVAACSGGDGPTDPTLTSIELSPLSATLQTGATQQFTATGHFSDGGTATVPVDWAATGGAISPAGLYTADAVVGSYQVTATQTGGSIAGTATVTITPAPPTLTSISVSPASVTLIPLATQQFTATAHYSDNSTGTIPVDWTATGGAVSGDGFYTAGVTDGSFQVTATATGGTVSGSATVTVATPPPNLVAIEISPSTLVRLKPKTTAQYTAIGRLSDGGTTPVAIDWTTTSAPPPAIAPYNTIAADGLFKAGHALGSFLVVATQHSGTLADTVTVNVHETTGKTVQGPLFWAPVAGSVYMCTSNHFTDDGDGLGGVATISAVDGVVAPSTRSYTNIGAPFMYADGAGEVQVICSEVWHAPSGLVGTEQVTIDVVSNRPGTGMAKVFVYTNPCLTSDCRAGFTTQLPIPDPNWTSAPVSVTVTVSASTGANIWFKNTLVP